MVMPLEELKAMHRSLTAESHASRDRVVELIVRLVDVLTKIAEGTKAVDIERSYLTVSGHGMEEFDAVLGELRRYVKVFVSAYQRAGMLEYGVELAESMKD